MPVFFLAPYPVFGTAKARKPESYQRRSPYYWWWAYLKRNADYLECCANGGQGRLSHLYEDFGDVRGDEFRIWWSKDRRGVKLFGEQPLEVKFHELESPSDWQSGWTKENAMVVVFPLVVSKRRLKGHINRLLDQRHSGKTGRPSLGKVASTARYKLSRNYTIQNLSTMLDVYDLYVANAALPKEQQMRQWEIGVKLKLNKRAVKEATSKIQFERTLGRNHLGAVVKRYLVQAQKTIKTLEQGTFPFAK